MKISTLLLASSVAAALCFSQASHAAVDIGCQFDPVFAAKNPDICKAYSEDFCKNYDRNERGYCKNYYDTREKLEAQK